MGKIIEFGTGQERCVYAKYFDYFSEDPFWDDYDLAERVIYSQLLNKMVIAEYNGQRDSSGKVYCQMTIEEIMRVAKVGRTKAKGILKKLKVNNLVRVERPNKRDANYLYVREYIPEEESLRVAERLLNESECVKKGSESGFFEGRAATPREGRQTSLKANKYNNNYYSLSKIQNESKKVKRNFGGFSQRDYQPNFYAELEKRLCGSG